MIDLPTVINGDFDPLDLALSIPDPIERRAVEIALARQINPDDRQYNAGHAEGKKLGREEALDDIRNAIIDLKLPEAENLRVIGAIRSVAAKGPA